MTVSRLQTMDDAFQRLLLKLFEKWSVDELCVCFPSLDREMWVKAHAELSQFTQAGLTSRYEEVKQKMNLAEALKQLETAQFGNDLSPADRVMNAFAENMNDDLSSVPEPEIQALLESSLRDQETTFKTLSDKRRELDELLAAENDLNSNSAVNSLHRDVITAAEAMSELPLEAMAEKIQRGIAL